MPAIAPEWEVNKDAEEMIGKIVEKYSERFNHIDPKLIGVAMVTNKDKPDGWDGLLKIVGLKEPLSLFSPKQYILWFHKSTWEHLTENVKVALLVSTLLRLPPDFDGSVLPPDLKDVKSMVRAFGVDYLENPELPNLLETEVKF